MAKPEPHITPEGAYEDADEARQIALDHAAEPEEPEREPECICTN